jgi:hypothetical protein
MMSKLVKIPKDVLKAHVKNISEMEYNEIKLFERDMSVSNADDQSKDFLERAIKIRLTQLDKADRVVPVNPIAVCSELREGEV